MNSYLAKLCEFEKKTIEMRKTHIKSFEEAVAEVNVGEDMTLFIGTNKAPELTHKYSKVLSFLDWNYEQKQ